MLTLFSLCMLKNLLHEFKTLKVFNAYVWCHTYITSSPPPAHSRVRSSNTCFYVSGNMPVKSESVLQFLQVGYSRGPFSKDELTENMKLSYVAVHPLGAAENLSRCWLSPVTTIPQDGYHPGLVYDLYGVI